MSNLNTDQAHPDKAAVQNLMRRGRERVPQEAGPSAETGRTNGPAPTAPLVTKPITETAFVASAPVASAIVAASAAVVSSGGVVTPSATATSAQESTGRHLDVWRDRFVLRLRGSEVTLDLVKDTLWGLARAGVRQRGRQLVCVSNDEREIIVLSEEALKLTISESFWPMETGDVPSDSDIAALDAATRELDARVERDTRSLEKSQADAASASDDIKKRRLERLALNAEKAMAISRRLLDSATSKATRAREKADKIATSTFSSEDLEESISPVPRDLARTLVRLGDYPRDLVPELVGIRHTPFFRADGSLCSTPGFDEASGVYLSADAARFGSFARTFTAEDAQAAASTLLDLIVDVPGSDTMRASWLTAVLTPLYRQALPTAPLLLFEANAPRVGKTQAACAAVEIATGGHAPPLLMYDKSAEETDKQIRTRCLNSSPGPILIDNFEGGRFGSPLVSSLLTSDGAVELRHMGSTKAGLSSTGWTMYVTANNPVIDADLTMRTLPIRLHYDGERPDLRSEFTHNTPPLRRARANVLALTRAGIIILLAHQAAGYPQPDDYRWGSFEKWVERVRAAVMFAGLPDPCADRESLVATDANADFVQSLARALREIDPQGKGLTAGQIAEKALVKLDLREALEEVRDARGGVNTRYLGWKLKHVKGRVSGGFRIVSRRGRTNQHVWLAEEVASKGAPRSGAST